MRTLTAALFAAAVVAAPGAAKPRKGDDLAALLAGREAGKPQSCISLHPSLNSQTVGHAIVYQDTSRVWYVNQPNDGQCTSLTSSRAFISRTPGTQLCRGDIIQIIDPPLQVPLGSCVLGDFTPYRKPAATAQPR